MHKNLYRPSVILSLACLGLFLATSAHAATVPINFTGTEQTFAATLDLSGPVIASGSGFTPTSAAVVKAMVVTNGGPFILDPNPTSIDLSQPLGPSDGSYNPKSNGATSFDVLNTGLGVGSIVNMSSLDLDMLNGGTFPQNPINGAFFLDTISLAFKSTLTPAANKLNSLVSPYLTIDLNGNMTALTFAQTGAYSFTPTGLNSGTFSVDGNLAATLNLSVSIDSGTFSTEVPAALTTGLALTGSYKVTGPTSNTKVTLDGALGFNQQLSLVTGLNVEFSSPPTTINFNLTANISLSLPVAYHLEQSNLAVPEPGSVVLLLIGMSALVPVVRYRMRRRKA